MNVKEQLRRNTVALISLVVAITSLGYNTWRNEASEANRTQRLVALEVLLKLGELQQVTWHHHYDKDFENKGNLRTGWTLVLVIRDICQILDEPLPDSAMKLYDTWNANYRNLESSTEAKDAVLVAINDVRKDTLDLLIMLD
ncbi:MAG: hypothetical protein QNI96_15730 [Woeseiaceae bacterium]|nr:hypothetical protein [Woeseiaceae bacterium]